MIRLKYLVILCLVCSCSGSPHKQIDSEQTVSQSEQTKVAVEKPSTTWEATSVRALKSKGYFPKFLANDNRILHTDSKYNGLWSYDLNTNKSYLLTTELGSGYQPYIFQEHIVFRAKGKRTSFHLLDLTNGEEKIFSKKKEAIQMAVSKPGNSPFIDVADDLNSLVIYENGKDSKQLRPGDFSNYLNPSFSPDGTKILFEVSGLGGFVAGTDGKIVSNLGDLDQPSWVNNKEVVYTKTIDVEMEEISNLAFIQNLVSGEEWLISKGLAEQVASISSHPEGKKMIANSPDGDLFLIFR